MTLPSKELLSIVLGFEVRSTYIADNTLLCTKVINKTFTGIRINIYELQHMMKEWAWEHKWIMKSGINRDGKGFCEGMFGIYQADTEFEAVTSACEWILKEAI